MTNELTNGAITCSGPIEKDANTDSLLMEGFINKQPNIIRVKKNNHSVVPTGFTQSPGFIVNDPGHYDNNTLIELYNNNYQFVFPYEENNGAPESPNLTIMIEKK